MARSIIPGRLPPLTVAFYALFPKNGQVFQGDQIPVKFMLVTGRREQLHAYVEGELMGMFKGDKGTLTEIKPGNHTLELRAVMQDHQTELEATDRVKFVVQ